MREKFLIVEAEVRYWEDTKVDGVEDFLGINIPFKDGNLWKPVIDLESGLVVDWPEGIMAEIHYKVCDQGRYWLADEDKVKRLKWKGMYVPNEFLCFGDDGWGDYIIFNVNSYGKILNYKKPIVHAEEWRKK